MTNVERGISFLCLGICILSWRYDFLFGYNMAAGAFLGLGIARISEGLK